jgi:hypothetical protein
MFEFLPEICRELRGTMLEIYWIMLIPITLFCICLEFFKMPDGSPQAGKIIKRVVVSMILLITFDETMQVIAMVCDGMTEKINGIKGIHDLLNLLKDRFSDFTVSWFKAKEAIVFIIAFLSYLIAYVSVFLCNVLIHFVWSLLFICGAS